MTGGDRMLDPLTVEHGHQLLGLAQGVTELTGTGIGFLALRRGEPGYGADGGGDPDLQR